jgi:hypothetical protein
MWFRALSLVIAAALLVKASIALAIPDRFYAARRRQYASRFMPRELLIPPLIVLSVTAIAWYATFAHYRPWGWIVTGSLTALACGSLHNLARWRQHRRMLAGVVANPRVWIVDCALIVVGVGFVWLAVFVY